MDGKSGMVIPAPIKIKYIKDVVLKTYVLEFISQMWLGNTSMMVRRITGEAKS